MLIASIQPPEADGLQSHARSVKHGWELVDRAADQGAKLIVLPEYFNVCGLDPAEIKRTAAKGHDFLDETVARARRLEALLLVPMIIMDQGACYNRAYLLTASGGSIYHYDKVHLTATETEALGLTAGDRIEPVDTEVGRIGVMTCYDVYFPEVARMLGLLGAQIILFPSLQRSELEETARIVTRVRAMDAWAYVVRSSYGQPADRPFRPGMMFGGSCIVSPDGSVLADAGHHAGIALAEIDLSVPWQRPPCHGRAPEPVSQFLRRDRRSSLYKRIGSP